MKKLACLILIEWLTYVAFISKKLVIMFLFFSKTMLQCRAKCNFCFINKFCKVASFFNPVSTRNRIKKKNLF